MIDPDEAKARSRGESVDMSPEAIEKRLRLVSHLREVCLVLGRAKILGPVEPPAPARPSEEPANQSESTAAPPNSGAP